MADEVGKVSPNRCLSTEVQALLLQRAQREPEQLLRFRRILPQLARTRNRPPTRRLFAAFAAPSRRPPRVGGGERATIDRWNATHDLPAWRLEYVLFLFYIISMPRESVLSALRKRGRAQLGLMEECRRRAEKARDPRISSAWIGVLLRLSRALTGTAEVLARFEARPELFVEALPFANLRLPELPRLPGAHEGYPPPSQNSNTTEGRNAHRLNRLPPLPPLRGEQPSASNPKAARRGATGMR